MGGSLGEAVGGGTGGDGALVYKSSFDGGEKKMRTETVKNFCRHCGNPIPERKDRYNESCCLACAGLVPNCQGVEPPPQSEESAAADARLYENLTFGDGQWN
jgi:hypothetical protein